MKENINTQSEESPSSWGALENSLSFENHIANLSNSDEEAPIFDFDMAFEKAVDTATLSQPMKDFFERQGYDIYNLPSGLGRPLLNVDDIGDMYYKKGSWREAKRSDIFVGDIVGSQGIKEHNATLASFMSYLYRDYDDASSYSGRGVMYLKDDYRKTVQVILDNLTPSDYVSDGKNFFLCGDGNHRVFFLATALELELAECGDDEIKKNEIISKYTIPAMICPTESVKDLGAILEEKTELASFKDTSDSIFI